MGLHTYKGSDTCPQFMSEEIKALRGKTVTLLRVIKKKISRIMEVTHYLVLRYILTTPSLNQTPQDPGSDTVIWQALRTLFPPLSVHPASQGALPMPVHP